MTANKAVAILNSKAPISQPHGKDSLDLALIFGSYEQQTSLFFQGDGVWQLIGQQNRQQNAELVNGKNYLKTFAALEFYDIKDLFACQKSLTERGLTDAGFHVDNVIVLNQQDFTDKLNQQDIIFRF
jgi:tRNA 2-thiouridine synthesizing protein C